MNKKNHSLCNSICLYIEPYVYCNVKDNGIILYNTLNKENIIIKDHNLIKKIKTVIENNSCFVLTKMQLEDETIREFIDEVEIKHIGGVSAMCNSNIPVIIRPFLQLINDNNIVVKEDLKSINIDYRKKNILDNVNELNIYLNSFNHSYYQNIYQQTNLCAYSKVREEASIYNVKTFIDAFLNNHFLRLKFFGGDILNYKDIDELLSYISNMNVYKEFTLFYNIINDDKINKILNSSLIIVNIVIDNILVNAENVVGLYKDYENIYFTFLIRNIKELELYKSIKNSFIDLVIIHVFVLSEANDTRALLEYDKKSILNQKLNMDDLFLNQYLNKHNYGKLYLFNNGNIHSNVNREKLGNIFKDDIQDVVMKELYNGESWLLTRDSFSLCQNCVYSTFCPPISNYEICDKEKVFCKALNIGD